MAKETTYAGTLGEWMRFLQALVANGGDLGHLEGSRAKLAGILERAQGLTEQQAAATAVKQEASRQFRTLLVEGRRLHTVLHLAVKEHYGIRSEKLAEFGMQPFRGRKVKPRFPEIEKPSSPTE